MSLLLVMLQLITILSYIKGNKKKNAYENSFLILLHLYGIPLKLTLQIKFRETELLLLF